jgi:hypothetical protein
MAHTTERTIARKTKKSYTLSPQSVAFLEAQRKKRRAPSASFVLEEILQTFRRGEEKRAMERAIADYYSSLSPEEAGEQVKWGAYALGEFPGEAR